MLTARVVIIVSTYTVMYSWTKSSSV